MTFALSQQSEDKLYGVHPDLVRVIKRAILLTTQDFAVTEGVRSTAEEAEHVANGTSHTMNSKHLVQSDGYGHAGDLVPWVNGALVWALPAAVQWKFIYPVAAAVQQAAIAESVRLRWGGCWDKVINDMEAGAAALQAAVVEYCARHPGRTSSMAHISNSRRDAAGLLYASALGAGAIRPYRLIPGNNWEIDMGTVETFKDKAVAEFGVIVGQVSAHPKTAAFVGLLGWALLALKTFL